MNKLPGLSVIVPNYNHGHFLPKCLESIFNQNIQPTEVIVIDDNSSDNSIECILGFQKRYSNLHFLKNEVNKGVVSVINSGLEVATQEYIMFLSADDWIMPNIFYKSLSLLTRHPESGLCSTFSLQMIESKHKLQKFLTPIPLYKPGYIPPKRVEELLLKDDSWFMGNTLILSRQKAKDFGGFCDTLRSLTDNILYKQLSLQHGCCFIPEILGVWRRPLLQGFARTTLEDPQLMQNLMIDAVSFMRHGNNKNLFSDKLIEKWKKRWKYMMLNALFSLKIQNKMNINILDKDIKILYNYSCINKRNFLANNYLFRKIISIYLFVRFRYFDIMPVLLRRLTWIFWIATQSK